MDGEKRVKNEERMVETSEITENTQNSADVGFGDHVLTFPPPRPIRELQDARDVTLTFRPIREMSAGVRQDHLEPFFLTGPDEHESLVTNERQNPLQLQPFLNPAQRALEAARPRPRADGGDPLALLEELSGALHEFLVPRSDPLDRVEAALDQLADHGELTDEEHAALVNPDAMFAEIDEAERSWQRLQAVLQTICDGARVRRNA
ncbi:hypothetical protein R3P38DRAFT_3173014 [Favolaschia claudopus]|uniref:DUF2017 domain-containing protein n=1 Tax=Favolaschia claudopus TaxID=2862362 RepID=A0AAW0DJN0_9AGAR